MKQIEIAVCDKVARLVDENTIIICGNSDYVANFNFDSEWDAYDVKTARFKWSGKYEERVFTGTQCDIPVINDTSCVYIGVYAGNISTTTGVRVPTQKSILCGSPVHNEPKPDVYNQIIALLEGIEGASEEEIAAAVAKYIAENPIEEKDPTVPAWAKTETKPTYTANEVGAIAESELQTAINTALAQAKASGEFDGADGAPGKDGQDGADGQPGADGAPGADGKSAYAYAVEGGYSGTEAEFAVKLAAEKFANPYALTFTGAATGSYDGSEAVTVEIPSGGGSSGGSGKAKTQKLIDQEITELTASLSVTLEHDFHNLTAIINCGSDGAALTADSDGAAAASKIGLYIDTDSYSYNSRKVAYVDTTSTTWQTRMIGAEWSDDLSVFKRGFTVEISTGLSNKTYYFPFGGTYAMYGTLGTDDNAPRTGKTANIVVNGAYLNVGTRVVLWGEYYE